MELWMNLLFGNWIGLLSMFVIAFTVGMAVFFAWLFIVKSRPPV
jgi:hypothetical protein